MKAIYFFALVVLCSAAPPDKAPQNLRANVKEENGKVYCLIQWAKVNSDQITKYKVKFWEGKLYYSEGKKEDGSKKVEVVSPTNPEKPITEVAEYDVPASQNQYRHDIRKAVVYQIAVRACNADGCGPLSEKVSISYL